MFDKIKEIGKDFTTGLSMLAIICAVVVSYLYMVKTLGLSENYEIVLSFAPMIMYAAYMMGGLRRLNRK